MRLLVLSTTLLALAACSAPPAEDAMDSDIEADDMAMAAQTQSNDHISAAVNDPSRPESETARDAGRHPADVLTFAGVQPGWRVAELGAGSGYYSRILSSAVGADGEVISENMDWLIQRFPSTDEAISSLASERSNVTRLVTPTASVLEGYENELDAAFMMLIYHDQTWQPEGIPTPTAEDRAAMNRSIYDALRPGGVFLVVDHRAEDGTGDSMAGVHHRIDEAFVREEVLAAGFELVAESDLLANPDDSRTTSVFDPSIRGNTDRFVLLFRKPL
ncbi:hypothetical protein V0U79_09380 [Hyphobacterium sp. HN65]|uniref:Methyltransferase n=1 Tax=Hyphobacterium lacteum TaxID=3116575 RepID=A0ABU7LRN2_9PROT|nr:hypothetical protein [Hyphobacterium sp. HN65]MEE2526578.1 hypothetical protein [Hyphobacterium sp. HN65]